MSADENKAIVRRFMEAYNNRQLDIFDELVAEDYIDHVFEQRGREYLRQLFTMAFEAFPDWMTELVEGLDALGPCGTFRHQQDPHLFHRTVAGLWDPRSGTR